MQSKTKELVDLATPSQLMEPWKDIGLSRLELSSISPSNNLQTAQEIMDAMEVGWMNASATLLQVLVWFPILIIHIQEDKVLVTLLEKLKFSEQLVSLELLRALHWIQQQSF